VNRWCRHLYTATYTETRTAAPTARTNKL